MALFVCKCLNVTLETDKFEENIDVGKLNLTSAEQRDSFFSEVPSKLISCNLSTLRINVAQPALVIQRTVGCCTFYSCVSCGQTTHVTSQDRPNTALISKSTSTTQEKVNNLKQSNTFSPVFNMIVPETSTDVEMKENVDTSNLVTSTQGWTPSQNMIGSLSKQMNKTLQSKLQTVEEMVRQFRDQKYAEFEAYRERAYRDHKILSSMISKARSTLDEARVDAGLDNGPPSPDLLPLQRRRLSSIKDKQIKSVRAVPPEEDFLHAEDLFYMEGTDSHHNMSSDQDDYDSDLESDTPRTRRARGPSAADLARSLPISMPKIPHERHDCHDLDDDEEPQDIAASIKALARSVHGDAFELPRPRFSTQI